MPQETEWIFFAGLAKRSSARRALAYRLAARFPVIIVRQPISFLRSGFKVASLRSRITEPIPPERCIEYDPVYYPARVPLIGPWFQGYGNKRLAAELNELLAPYGPARRIVCYDSPTQYPLVKSLGENLSVYLAIDDRTVTVEGEPIAGELEAERQLLHRVDRVVCVSEPLAKTLRARIPDRPDLQIDVLTNGYDEHLFDPHRQLEEPTELAGVSRPRILVAGHVSERIDWDGIRTAATLRPQWSWVFVGPADDGMEAHVTSIQTSGKAGAFLFQPVPYESIPAWIAHCDACAVPYRLNNFTLASSPLKAIEYLGAGAPTLSTKIPSLTSFGCAIEWVQEGDGPSYARALDQLMAQDRTAEAVAGRCSAVRDQSMHSKVQALAELLR